MAFENAFTAEQPNVGPGTTLEAFTFDALATDTFESGLIIGRFAKLDTGSIDNMDSSATPVIAGVVKREARYPIEAGGTVTTAAGSPSAISYVRNGYVAVEVKTGDTPAVFGTVYADNVGATDYGKATVTALNNIDVGAEFIKEIKTNVWLIRIK